MISCGDIYRESTVSLLSTNDHKKDPEGIFPRTFGVDESASSGLSGSTMTGNTGCATVTEDEELKGAEEEDEEDEAAATTGKEDKNDEELKSASASKLIWGVNVMSLLDFIRCHNLA